MRSHVYSQNQTNALAGSQAPLARRPNNVLGGGERAIDETGEKVKEDFLHFLSHYREGGSSAVGVDPTSGFAVPNLTSITTLPTSEMLTPSEGVYAASREEPFYVNQLQDMRRDGHNTLFVDFTHIYRYNDVLANAIAESYYRFEPFLREAVRAFVGFHAPSYLRLPSSNQERDFWISIYGISLVHKLRELTTNKLGQLVSISGTVTRTSEVRPELLVGTFRCNDCITSIERNVDQQFKYTEPIVCSNESCNNRSSWTLLPEQSKFADWQRIRLQENSNEIPPGNMPRCIDVIVRNEMTERAKPGDKCVFTGTLIVIPDIAQLLMPGNKIERGGEYDRNQREGDGVSGLKALGVRELTYKLAFLAGMVQTSTSGSNSFRGDDEEGEHIKEEGDRQTMFTQTELDEIEKIRSTPQLYNKMVNSIAPSIFGHQEIKAGILLMLFGGVHKTTPEGINLRGDINVCIVGDPGTAKSQFLRYVIGFLPRSVYTSGKASSAAGLTASVLKDEETGDFTIEAGALMLADNGICAIDEFDKMDISDQVAIHEAMEQQTISISKAGIQATLNARTSILAAANPVGGRYDRKKTLRQNIAMSAPIMSRFDLFFVILDEFNEQNDFNIAKHLLAVHKNGESPVATEFSTEQIQRYLRYCRTLKPRLDSEAAELLVEKYKQLRANDATGVGTSYRMTVRQLESLIRLSEAIARLHCDERVRSVYVHEACRLLKSSIIRVEMDNIDLDVANAEWEEASRAIDAGAQQSIETTNSTSFKLKYEDYIRISNMLVFQLRRAEEEEQAMAMESDSNATSGGMRKNQLVEWYLEQIEDELESEADYFKKKAMVNSLVDRLINKDSVLIAIKEGLDQDPLLVVHPNYSL